MSTNYNFCLAFKLYDQYTIIKLSIDRGVQIDLLTKIS